MKSIQEEQYDSLLNQKVTAARRCLSMDKLMEFLNDDAPKVRRSAATNPNATPEVLMFAMGSSDVVVRRNAAKNLRADEKVLLKALSDDDSQVASNAARNQSATDKVVLKALKNKRDIVREGAVFNPSIKPVHLIKALDDSDCLIASSAADMLYEILTATGVLDEKTEDSWKKDVLEDPLLRLSVLVKVSPPKKSRSRK